MSAQNPQGVFRNFTILKELNINTTDYVEIYKPNNPNLGVPGNTEIFSGFITSLRLNIFINSIPETIFPYPDPLDSQAEIQAELRNIQRSSPRKNIGLFLSTDTISYKKVADIILFNQKPYYYLDLLPYLTSSDSLDLAPNAALSMKVTTVGHGLLGLGDTLIVFGSALEESPIQPPDFTVNTNAYCFDSSSGGNGGSRQNLVVDNQGNIVTDSQGNIITHGES